MTPADVPAGRPDGAAAAGAVGAVLDGVFATITGIGDAYLDLWRRRRGRPVVAADLEPLRVAVHERLRASAVIGGCGVVVAPGVVADRERHLVWWQRGAAGAPERLVLDLDPAGEDSYDYPAMPWFTTPQDEDRRAVHGPYVDFRGANTYVYTFALPVRDGAGFLGVAGADVPVQLLEPVLLAALGRLGVAAVVVAADRRVVVANTGRWVVGSRLRSFPDGRSADFVEVHPVTGDLGWVLALAAPDEARGRTDGRALPS